MTGVISGQKAAPAARPRRPSCAGQGVGQLVAVGHELDRDHQCDADQDARHDARKEQRGHAFAHHIGVDDHDARRRDDRPDDRACGGDRGGEGLGVALLFHLRDDDRPQSRDIGHRRPRDTGEEHGVDDVHLRQTAPEVADHRLREADDPGRDAAPVHQLARQHEEGDCHQGKEFIPS
jgi:hypothetical protein